MASFVKRSIKLGNLRYYPNGRGNAPAKRTAVFAFAGGNPFRRELDGGKYKNIPFRAKDTDARTWAQLRMCLAPGGAAHAALMRMKAQNDEERAQDEARRDKRRPALDELRVRARGLADTSNIDLISRQALAKVADGKMMTKAERAAIVAVLGDFTNAQQQLLRSIYLRKPPAASKRAQQKTVNVLACAGSTPPKPDSVGDKAFVCKGVQVYKSSRANMNYAYFSGKRWVHLRNDPRKTKTSKACKSGPKGAGAMASAMKKRAAAAAEAQRRQQASQARSDALANARISMRKVMLGLARSGPLSGPAFSSVERDALMRLGAPVNMSLQKKDRKARFLTKEQRAAVLAMDKRNAFPTLDAAEREALMRFIRAPAPKAAKAAAAKKKPTKAAAASPKKTVASKASAVSADVKANRMSMRRKMYQVGKGQLISGAARVAAQKLGNPADPSKKGTARRAIFLNKAEKQAMMALLDAGHLNTILSIGERSALRGLLGGAKDAKKKLTPAPARNVAGASLGALAVAATTTPALTASARQVVTSRRRPVAAAAAALRRPTAAQRRAAGDRRAGFFVWMDVLREAALDIAEASAETGRAEFSAEAKLGLNAMRAGRVPTTEEAVAIGKAAAPYIRGVRGKFPAVLTPTQALAVTAFAKAFRSNRVDSLVGQDMSHIIAGAGVAETTNAKAQRLMQRVDAGEWIAKSDIKAFSNAIRAASRRGLTMPARVGLFVYANAANQLSGRPAFASKF